jgi:DNA-binding NtrC family response regulator
MTKPLAFIIDDDKLLGEAFRQALEFCGFQAVHIIDSTLALPLIIERQPDVILLDMQMPKLNGAQLLRSIRNTESTQYTKVIVATANHLMLDDDVREMAQLTLQKPVNLQQIMEFAQRMLKLETEKNQKPESSQNSDCA